MKQIIFSFLFMRPLMGVVSGFSGGLEAKVQKGMGKRLLRGNGDIHGDSRASLILVVEKDERRLQEDNLDGHTYEEFNPFCNFGPDGTGKTSTCEGGAANGNRCNGDWCNDSEDNCKTSGGRWCVEGGTAEPWYDSGKETTGDSQEYGTYEYGIYDTTPEKIQIETTPFCNFGPDGSGETSTCEGGAANGNRCNGDWCNDSEDNCKTSGGRWCAEGGTVEPLYDSDKESSNSQEYGTYENGTYDTTPENIEVETTPFCNFGPDGSGETSTCEGGAADGNRCNGDWCNDSEDNCEASGGRWCVE